MSIFDPLFWLYFLYFLISVFSAFFIPGDLALRKLKLTFFQRFVLGTLAGMVLWGWQGFVLGYLGIRWLSYFYIFATFVAWIKLSLPEWKGVEIAKQFQKIRPSLTIILIVVGSLMQLTIVWFVGISSQNSLYFCCGNTSDNLFHIALTNQIVKNFPPFQPGMYGVVVHNYHYWSNLVTAELIRVFNLPLIPTQFQYSTVLISLFLGLSAVVFAQIAKLPKIFANWLIFFLYFGGDLAYIVLFAFGRGLNFRVNSLEDGLKFLENPPRAFSIIILFAGLSLLTLWVKKKNIYTGILMAIILGSLIGFKVYTGIFALVGLAFLSAYYLLRKDFKMLIPPILALFLALIIYLPVNDSAGGLYFTGTWRFENYVVQPEFGQERLSLAMQIFKDHNNWIRIIQYDLIFFSIYILSVFGTKSIGLFQSKKSLSLLPREINIFLISGIIVSALAGFFFQQASGGANTFNFIVSIFIIGSIYSALSIYYWLGKVGTKTKLFLIFIILLLTIPRVIHRWTLNFNQLKKSQYFVVSSEELQAFEYIKKNASLTSYVLVDDRTFAMDGYSPYISFLINRPIYLSGKGILESHGVVFSDRLKVADLVLRADGGKAIEEIGDKRIGYIVTSTDIFLNIEKSPAVKRVFEKNKVKILKISSNDI